MDDLLQILNTIRPDVDFTASKDFINEGLIDSFDLITLVSDLDEKFSISIPGDEIIPENFASLETIQDLLKRCGV